MIMKILCFDTALNKLYVALGEDNKVLYSKIIENENNNFASAQLASTIVEVLSKFGLTLNDIDALGVNIGPGSFTGIRASLTIAKVISSQLNIPLVGVNSFEILSNLNNQNEKIAIILDARKNNAFISIFENDKCILAPKMVACEDIANLIQNANVITDDKMSKIVDNSLNYELHNFDLGEKLLKKTYKKLLNESQNNKFLYGNVVPLYLQEPFISKPKTIMGGVKN